MSRTSLRTNARESTSLSIKLTSANLGLRNSCDFRILQLLKVKEDGGSLRVRFIFQLRLECCNQKVMITADVCTRKCPYARPVDAVREVMWNQN